MNNSVSKCRLCGLDTEYTFKDPADLYSCENCGLYKTFPDFPLYVRNGAPKDKARLSHYVNKMQKGSYYVALDRKTIEDVLKTHFLPTPSEQIDNLIIWLGENVDAPGDYIERLPEHLIAVIGALNSSNAKWTIEEACSQGLVNKAAIIQKSAKMQLSFKGWQHYESVRRRGSQSKIAFMAMQFNDEELDMVVDNYFKPAVEKAGFRLKRLIEDQPCGLIDDRLRVEIRMSRFLIADLTHENKGAYWEAGFAEGLGMNVIYTCKEEIFEEKGSHFDTNHHLTILWDPNNLEKAANDLKATIRATLPNEAVMSDN